MLPIYVSYHLYEFEKRLSWNSTKIWNLLAGEARIGSSGSKPSLA